MKEAALTLAGIAIAIIIAIIVIPTLSGRIGIGVTYLASADTLEAQNRTLLESYNRQAITVSDIRDLQKLGDHVIAAKEKAGNEYGDITAGFTVNGFEYYSLNSRLGGKLDDGWAMISYNGDYYIIGARKY